MRTPALMLLLTFLVLASCGHGPQDSGHEHAAASTQDTQAGSTAPSVLPALVLDRGEKWPLDAPTRHALAAMGTTLREADAESVPGRQAAGSMLRAQLDGLIAGCTMSGSAHDQLHVWLAATIPALDALESDSDAAASRQRLEDVQSLLELADRHFA